MKWTATLFAIAAALGLAAVASTGCQPKPVPQPIATAPHVRVRLLAGVNRCTLSADQQTPVLTANGTAATAFTIDASGDFELTFDGLAWHGNGSVVPQAAALLIHPRVDGGLRLNGAAYRGTLALVPSGPAQFDVINDLDVESYLRGVLGRELLADWRDEAYKAQAVIARTYALYEARTGPSARAWDLNPDERSQVYGGVKAESPRAVAAVEATRGIVAAYGPPGQEKIFKAYFSACCGGVSSSAADVFNEPPIPPLGAKSNGTLCSISPRFNWPTLAVSKAELARRFRLWGQKMSLPEANLPGIQTITIVSMNAFNRPTAYLLTDTRGQQYRLTAEQLRNAINTDAPAGTTVFSGFFKPVDAGDAIRFTEGHGFGHGVGACQWCMQARALAGQDFRQIVMDAYPQAVLVRAF